MTAAPDTSIVGEGERAGSGDLPAAPDPADLEPIPTDSQREAFNLIGWHFARLRKLRHDRAELVDRFNDEIERIQRLRDERAGVADREIERRIGLIEDAHRALYAAGMADKTILTPHGTSKLREGKTSQVFAPDRSALDALIPWAEAHHPHLVKKLLGIADVRKVVQACDDGKVIDPTTGEVLDGLVAQVPGVTVSVHPDEGEPV